MEVIRQIIPSQVKGEKTVKVNPGRQIIDVWMAYQQKEAEKARTVEVDIARHPSLVLGRI